jgi:uncharacterized protein YrzB (UPF0473 family)
MSENHINPIDALFDENNNDLILLYNEEGNPVAFEQIAVIPLGAKAYAILKPAEPMAGVAYNEAFVFAVETEESGEEYLALVADDDEADQVFNIYNTLIEAELDDEDFEDGEDEDAES